ncbi:MAG: ribosome biogenesis GTPase Der [Rhodospirillales bacterium]|nr:ribosome biogenesis GTPase Der [Rhodospirillales bacterium]
MLPLVVIAGRPNVGKSTLFNRLVGRRLAIVADTPGVTRDRREAEALMRGRRVRVADTAGLEEAPPESLARRMHESATAAIREADLVVFVVDGRAGIVPDDEHFAAWLRRIGRPVLLVANKAEGREGWAGALEAHRLGFGAALPVSAEHGEGIAELMGEIVDRLPEEVEAAGEATPLKLAVIGRPNAGKSTLVNRLLGEARLVTGPEPGLTRDAVAVVLQDATGPIEIVDTAGMRKRARVQRGLEQASVAASLAALKLAEVVVLLADATLGLEDQDLQLARLVEREGRALVIGLNKWDAVEDRGAARRRVADALEASLAQMKGIAVVPFSALTGAGVEKLLPAVRAAHATWNKRVPTGELNRWFEAALERHPPPLVAGRRLKLRYVTQAKARPPTFVVFGTRAEATPEDYRRYLANSLREDFDLPGVPLRIAFRGTENPYDER